MGNDFTPSARLLVTASRAPPVTRREFAGGIEHWFPRLLAIQALEDQFGMIDQAHAETGQLLFRHVAHIHFVQTNAVEDFHGGCLSGETPRDLDLMPAAAGVKAWRGGDVRFSGIMWVPELL